MIDLRIDTANIRAWCHEGLRAFVRENPGTAVTTVALYACPWAGWLLLALDTPEHSNAHVTTWGARGIPWVGTDEHGMFCDNPPDFAFNRWRSFDCDHWRAEYEETVPLIVDLDGVNVRPVMGEDEPEYEGDEGYNRVFYRALIALLRDMQRESGFAVVKAAPFRVGARMLDSKLCAYWVA